MASRTYTRRDVIVACLCGFVLVVTAAAVGQARRELAARLLCEQNLAQIGRAMLIYANDYEDEFPKAGGRLNQWVAEIPSWRAQTRKEAWEVSADSRSGKITTTSCLYLLIKYIELTPRQFVCKSEPDTREFRLTAVPEQLPEGFTLRDAWDFGGWYDSRNNPSRHCSYAFHMPFGLYPLTTSSVPGFPVAADRNPWMDPNRVADANEGWAQFDPGLSGSVDPDKIRLGNSDAHQRDGQNVLYLDSHVEFRGRPTCGQLFDWADDNIYSIASEESALGKAKGLVPVAYHYDDNTPGAHPFNRKDAVLVQETGDLPLSE
jgi:hypothetical protein